MAVVENVTAILKDIKVTKKGINITFEDVRLQGEQLQQLASLIGEVVLMGTDIPQMGLFDDEDVNEADEPEVVAEPETEGVDGEPQELLTDVEDNGAELMNDQADVVEVVVPQEPATEPVYTPEPLPLMSDDEISQELGI